MSKSDTVIIDYDHFEFTIVDNENSIYVKVLDCSTGIFYQTTKTRTELSITVPSLEIFYNSLINGLLHKENCYIFINMNDDKIYCWIVSKDVLQPFDTCLYLTKMYDRNVITNFENKIANLNIETIKLQTEITKLKKENNQLKKTNEKNISELKNQEKFYYDSITQLQKNYGDNEKLKTEIVQLQTVNKKLHCDFVKLQTELTQLKMDDKNSQLNGDCNLINEINRLQNKQKEFISSITELKKNNIKLESTNYSLNLNYLNLKKDYDDLILEYEILSNNY